MSTKKVLIKKGRQESNQNYLEIKVAPDSSAFVLFQEVLNMTTDSVHENFYMSSFRYCRLFNMSVQACFKFHSYEIHILLRRLRQYPEDKFNFTIPSWISFIQKHRPE